ncbi:unnamed protein product [Rhizophagus irregularis]|nr:unnamed protein product [Rhizophagus irregularis]
MTDISQEQILSNRVIDNFLYDNRFLDSKFEYDVKLLVKIFLIYAFRFHQNNANNVQISAITSNLGNSARKKCAQAVEGNQRSVEMITSSDIIKERSFVKGRKL